MLLWRKDYHLKSVQDQRRNHASINQLSAILPSDRCSLPLDPRSLSFSYTILSPSVCILKLFCLNCASSFLFSSCYKEDLSRLQYRRCILQHSTRGWNLAETHSSSALFDAWIVVLVLHTYTQGLTPIATGSETIKLRQGSIVPAA